MKHLIMALAHFTKAEQQIEDEYSRLLHMARARLDQDFAQRRRMVANAKASIQKRFAQTEAFHSEIWEKLRPQAAVAADTTARMKRGFKREQNKRSKYVSGKNTGVQKRGTRNG